MIIFAREKCLSDTNLTLGRLTMAASKQPINKHFKNNKLNSIAL